MNPDEICGLPGWVVNNELFPHFDEGLLAAGFIFPIHFFNTLFGPALTRRGHS
jgi:hypothetical protein